MAKPRLAVVLFNLGGPDSLKAVRPFLFNLFRDPAIIALPAPARLALATLISTLRARSAVANYARIGGASPLLAETQAQALALETALAELMPEVEAKAFIAMRYWRPFTHEAAAEVKAFAPDQIVLLPLYPQFSTTTTASSLKAWRQAYQGAGSTHEICCYPTDAGLIEAHARCVLQAWREAGAPRPIRVLFSAHGLPQTVADKGDPYQGQVEATAQALAERLKLEMGQGLDWEVCYQSRVGPMKWLGPYTIDRLTAAGAEGLGVLIAPIAFVSEHVETLNELDHDYAILARQAGCPLYLRAPALGIEQSFIDGMTQMVQKAVAGSCDTHPAGPWRCGEASGACPRARDAA